MTQTTRTIEAIKEEIKAEAIDRIVEELETMDAQEFCELANDYGDGDTLYLTLGEMFDGESISPIEAYEIGREYGRDIDEYATFYRYNWGEVEIYDCNEDAQDLEQMANALFDDEYFDDIMDEYNEAIEEAEEEERERIAQEQEEDRAKEEKNRAIIRLLAQVHDLLDTNPNATLEDIARVGATIIEVTTKEV